MNEKFLCWWGLFANLSSYSWWWWKFNAMKRMREAASSEQYLLPRTNKVSQEAAEVRIRSITRWSTMVTTNFFHVSLRTSQAAPVSAVMSMYKKCLKWTLDIILLLLLSCNYRETSSVRPDPGPGNTENKVGEIANQLKINSWELLAFIALLPFPPPASIPSPHPRPAKYFLDIWHQDFT